MEAAEFIVVAAKMVSLGKGGARSAISRAYYGAFHLASEFVREIAGETVGSGAAHNLVVQYLGATKDTNATSIARLLGDLHTYRIRADYRLTETVVETTAFAKNCVEFAHTIQSQLAELRQACDRDPHLRQAVVNGVAEVKRAHRMTR